MVMATCPTDTTILDKAREYASGDLNVIPIRADGSKAPAFAWDEYKTRKTTPQEINEWFGPSGQYRGIGIVLGAISGHLLAVDFDEPSLFAPWRELVDNLAPGLLDRLPIHKTPRGGRHVFGRNANVGGNKKLATEPYIDEAGKKKEKTLIELRAGGSEKGSQVLAPGCAAECHLSGGLYSHQSGPPVADAPIITDEELAILLSAARRFDKSDKSEHLRPFNPPELSTPSDYWEEKPGDAYDARASWEDILPAAGWKKLFTTKGVTHWQRPGKSGPGSSATTGHCGDRLYVFSSNASPFESEMSYTKFAAYALLNHQGDFKAAAKKLFTDGFGKKAEKKKDGKKTMESPFSATAGVPWPSPPADGAFYGYAGEVVRRIQPHSEADPAALLIQFLVAFGNVIGRTAHFMAEATKHYVNLYAVLVGDTAKGRKGSAWSNIRNIFAAADDIWKSTRVLTGMSSGEGLIWTVRDPIFKRESIKNKGVVTGHQDVEADPGIADKRLFILEQEFANVLKMGGREGNSLSPVIRLAWDCGTLQTLTKNSPARATDAHISIVGHITADELRRHLNATEMANGFANRFLWVCVRRSQYLPDGGEFHTEDIGAMVSRLTTAIQFAGNVGKMSRDAEANRLWHQVYRRLSDGRPGKQRGMLGAILSRAEAQVMRLACIYALLDFSQTVRVDHLRAALALWDYCERSASYIFDDSLGDKVADATMDLLRRNPDGVTRTKISEHFQGHKGKDDIDRALQFLQEMGFARTEAVETKGRSAEVWFAVEQGDISLVSLISQPDTPSESPNEPTGPDLISPLSLISHPAPGSNDAATEVVDL